VRLAQGVWVGESVAEVRATGASGRDGESAVDRLAGRGYDGDKFSAIFLPSTFLAKARDWLSRRC
jgi:hypothetical protein